MEIGTADIIEEPEKAKTKHGRRTGGSNKPGGNGKDPGGGGDDRGQGSDQVDDPQPFRPGISRILTGLLLVIATMTFGGLIAAYVVIATNNVAEWRPFDLPVQVWISTAIIILSSISYHFAKVAVDRNDQPKARMWLVVTTVFGAAFISSQLLAWLALSAKGLYMQGNPYAGFFYIMTGVHAVHVVGGITALGSVLLRNWHPTERTEETSKRAALAQVVGWYWHFMGAIWMVLFVLLGFWK